MHKEQLALMKSFMAYLDRSHQPLVTYAAPVPEPIIEPLMTEDHLPSKGNVNKVGLGTGLNQKQNKVLHDVTKKITNAEIESMAEKQIPTQTVLNSSQTVAYVKPGTAKASTVLSKSGISEKGFRPNILRKKPITLAQLRTMSTSFATAQSASPKNTTLAELRALAQAKSGNPSCSQTDLAAEALGKKLAAEQVNTLRRSNSDDVDFDTDSSEN